MSGGSLNFANYASLPAIIYDSGMVGGGVAVDTGLLDFSYSARGDYLVTLENLSALNSRTVTIYYVNQLGVSLQRSQRVPAARSISGDNSNGPMCKFGRFVVSAEGVDAVRMIVRITPF